MLNIQCIVVEMAVRTRNGKGHVSSLAQQGQRASKRQKVCLEATSIQCTMDEKENIIDSFDSRRNTPTANQVHEDDVIYIRKRMSAIRKHYSSTDTTDLKPAGEKHISPDNVLRLPPSMPTDDEGSAAVHGGKKHIMRRKTKSRVDSQKDSWLRKYPNDFSSPTSQQDSIGINSLPDSCLARIFKLSIVSNDSFSVSGWKKNPCLSTYPLVCKRWNTVLGSPSEIWNHIVIEEATSRKHKVALRNWMVQRHPSIHSVHFSAASISENEQGIRDLIDYLGAPLTDTIKSVIIDCENIDGVCLERILTGDPKRFRSITSLSLYGVTSLTKSTMHMLQGLSDLEAISIRFSRTLAQKDPFEEGDGSLSESLLQMSRLKSLSVDSMTIRNIQPTIARLNDLTELKLESMIRIQSIPLMFVHLHNLVKLSLRGSKSLFGNTGNRLDNTTGVVQGTERMFWMIRSLPKLEELNIDDCSIKEIPIIEGLPVNKSLKKLSMNDNPDMVFKKGLSAFQGLESLTMRRCNMPCVSSAVTSLSHLKYLDISNNGLVECNGLGKLTNLHVLKASHNQFPSIPKDIYSITGLKELELHGCVYLEFSSSLNFLADTWPKLYSLVVTKGSRGRYQARSLHWLHKLQDCLELRDRKDVVKVDDQKAN